MRLDLNSNDGTNNNEVPWHSVYSKNASNLGNTQLIRKVFISSKGLLLIGDSFKDFIFSGKKVHDLLLEALEYYVEHPNDSSPLFAIAQKGRSCILEVDTDAMGTGVWLKEEESYRFDQDDEMTPSTPSSNPFIPSHVEQNSESNGGIKRKRKSN